MNAKKYKVLLADDEQNIRLLGEKLLKDSGFEVVIASNGVEAIEKAIAEKPDIVITDIKMPQKNGFEVCKALRADPILAHTPIIILSALGDEFNKLTGFEGGANDFMTKPFRAEELNERIMTLINRQAFRPKRPGVATAAADTQARSLIQIPTGSPNLDRALGGGIPQGSNIMLYGALGKGKSTCARKFIAEGLLRSEKCLFVAVDDDPQQIKIEMSKMMPVSPLVHEKNGDLRFIDAYTWSTGENLKKETYSIEGVLSLDQLSNLMIEAGSELGQSVQKKLGGRRVIDSISSFFVNFESPAVQRFISQIGKTAVSFGGVTTLFVVEEGTANDQAINNIKHLMDGVFEVKEEMGNRLIRAQEIKWIEHKPDWVEI
jgi:two-component system, OmpR family, alkaline phosphatase synthesis response regulator PhoP